MKHWWHNVVKDYFTFTRKDRNGLIILFTLIAIIFFGVKFFNVKRQPVDTTAFQAELAQLKISIDSSRPYRSYRTDDYDDFTPSRNYAPKFERNTKAELFYFDPNTASVEEWKKLGLRDKTITTINNFLAKGYQFKKPEDIKRIYGLRPEDADRLVPYVRIAVSENKAVTAATEVTAKGEFISSNKPSKSAIPTVIDINLADTSQLIALPGIGSKLAARIISFRDKLGGFASIEQVGETYALPDSTFQKIKTRLVLKTTSIKAINLNSATIDELKSHPYIKWHIANAIVNYRKQHGEYKSVDDLRKIVIITEDIFIKIAPYLVI